MLYIKCHFWRPPGNRNPSLDEINMCLPFIKEQIEIINPKFLILLGNIASQTLLKNSLGITKICGQKFEYELGTKNTLLANFSSLFLLRNPYAKRIVVKIVKFIILLKKVMKINYKKIYFNRNIYCYNFRYKKY